MFYLQRSQITERERFNRIVFLLVFLGILLFSHFSDPFETNIFSCEFKEHTGKECLSCGMTRSLHATSHLDFTKAMDYHFAGPLLYIFILVYTLKMTVELSLNTTWKIKKCRL